MEMKLFPPHGVSSVAEVNYVLPLRGCVAEFDFEAFF